MNEDKRKHISNRGMPVIVTKPQLPKVKPPKEEKKD